MADLLIILSTVAAGAALWFQWSSARAAKRALALIKLDAPQREPGMTLEVIGVSVQGIRIRIVNPAGAWNMATALIFSASGDSKGHPKIAREGTDAALTVPFVVAAGATVTGHVCFHLHNTFEQGVVVLLDLDGRRREAPVTGAT